MMAGSKGRVAGAIITYQLAGLNSSRRTRFAENILGQDRKVGDRAYRRRGLLDTLPHWKVNRSVIVVHAQDRRRMVRAIQEWTSEVWWWPIPLSKAQARRLGIGHEPF